MLLCVINSSGLKSDFHLSLLHLPTVMIAMFKIDTSDVTNLLRVNTHKTVNLVKDPERRGDFFCELLSCSNSACMK